MYKKLTDEQRAALLGSDAIEIGSVDDCPEIPIPADYVDPFDMPERWDDLLQPMHAH